MANKKKITTSVVAVATAAALILGGTFAWQSISQTALNETDATINPGGRLHDDFDGENKDVYVENFADEDIFARVRLDEYLELTFNKGTPVEETQIITTGATKDDTDTYITHKFADENATDEFFTWNGGGETVYMPTFNKNKDSLTADVNGTMDYTDAEGNAKPYGDYVTYTEGETVTDDAVYDADTNTVDEFADDSAQENINYILVNEEHTAAKTGKAQLISMEEWLTLESDTDNYWVYDTDGWVYYSSPIKSGTATGLLLDGIELNQVMDDSYYYAINVVGQFITADDLGKDDNTGFYADADNLPSDNALALLKKIGVVTDKNTLAAGLYDANDKLLCAWEDCGIELNPTEEASAISDDAEDTWASDILKNKYPTTVKIILPDDATSIGDYVFSYCYNLVTIDIKNVETLGYQAFYNCNALTTVIGSNIKEIGVSCFSVCNSLTTLDISKVELIPNAALQDTMALTTLDLSNVKTVENSAFYCCDIKELDLSNVETLGSSALNCAMAEKVYLDKVTDIQDYAFSYMSNLKAIVYKDVAYRNVESLQAALEENGVNVKDYAFEECNFWQPSVTWEWELLDNNGDSTDTDNTEKLKDYTGTITANDDNTEFTYTGDPWLRYNGDKFINIRIGNTTDVDNNEITVTGYHLNLTGSLEECEFESTSEFDKYFKYTNTNQKNGVVLVYENTTERPAYIYPVLTNFSGFEFNNIEIVVEYTCDGLNYESAPLTFSFKGQKFS